jgi:hypothetical protein
MSNLPFLGEDNSSRTWKDLVLVEIRNSKKVGNRLQWQKKESRKDF